MASNSGNLKEPLTPQEKKFYGSIFKTLDPKNTGLISGKAAKPLLEASGLPLNLLGEIWNLSDPENNGVLNQFGFCVAMRLIAHTQQTGSVDINSVQKVASLAKFGTISVNNTGSGILNSNLSNPINSRVSSVNSNNSQSSNLNQQLLVPVLSKVQANSFGKMFDKVAINNLLPGDQARDIFLKARLPIPILEKIWNLVDQSKTGQLSKPQFIVAMHLIQCFMNKSMTILPAILSDQLWNSASNLASDNSNENVIKSPLRTTSVPIPSPTKNPSSIPAQSPLKQKSLNNPQSSNLTNLNTWIMSNQQKQQYGSIFDNLDKSNSNQITSGEVANFLMTSKLPNDVLASIWELANLNDTNVFDKQEFSIAMYLVQKKLAGYNLPNETPKELIDSSSFGISIPQQSQQVSQGQGQFQQPPQLHQQQSFATASQTAPQRSASHMDDLLDIFQTNQIQTSPVSQRNHVPPPAPAPRQSNTITGSFNPSSSFGRELQKQVEENESSDDDDGPENLDIPRTRSSAPNIPVRANKPHFDSNDALLNSNSNLTSTKYDALKNIDSLSPSENVQTQKSVTPGFSNQPVNVAFTNSVPIGGFTNLASNLASTAMAGFSVSNSAGNNNQPDVSNQLTQASVDIANYSNQINSLSKQTSVISGKKDKSQQELNKILKTKENMQEKLIQMRTLHERESLQVQEVQNLMLKSKEESNNLQQELSLAEASYHAEQAKLSQLQNEYEESQKMNQSIKEKLGTLNAEVIDLNQQIEEFGSKAKQASNILAVSQQQYASQELENQNLLSKIEELKNSIYTINLKHSKLINGSEDLKEQNLALHQKHTELSVDHAEKNIAYSETLANKASSGSGDISDDDNNDEEVPTSSLDDFDDEEFNSAKTKSDDAAVTTPAKTSAGTVPATPTNTNTDSNTITSKSLHVETPPTTQTTNDAYESNAPQQQFSLPFSIPHSETSSTQNNPSQSVRGDIDATESPASTIEENVPLSSQILPEGGDVGPSSSSSNENGESFEMVNHTDAENFTNNVTPENQSTTEISKPLTAQTSDSVLPSEALSINNSVDSSVVETLPDKPQNSQTNSDFSPAAELQIDDGARNGEDDEDDSSDDEQFQDATFTDDLEPAQQEDAGAASKNPFSGKTTDVRGDGYFDNTNTNTQPQSGPSMFDDLGLEEAPVEQAGDAFDNVNNGFSSTGFSFANNDVIDNSNVGSFNQQNSADGDDWEQVFAGFGNDPNLQPASIENEQSQTEAHHFEQPAVYGFSAEYDQQNSRGLNNEIQKDINKAKDEINSKYNQSQSMAIEELKGMGFEENEAVDALMQNNWNIDDASNYLLDAA